MSQDPMSRLGTSAAEASKAFQGLQEASKDLVDLEIVIPAGHQTDPTPLPPGTSLEWTDYLDQVAGEHDRNLSPEIVFPPKGPTELSVATILSGLPSPWLHEIRDNLASFPREGHADRVSQIHEALRPPQPQHPNETDTDQALRDPFREPWYKRLWSWLRGTK